MLEETKLILNALEVRIGMQDLELIVKAYELAKAKGDKVTLTDIKELK